MPTYSYRCTECDTAFDIQQSFSDGSLTVCPSCQGKLRKMFSAIGVSFTGSGFYRNDARADAKAAREPAVGGNTGDRATAGGKTGGKPSEKPGKAPAEKSSGAPAIKDRKPSASVSSAKTSAGAAPRAGS